MVRPTERVVLRLNAVESVHSARAESRELVDHIRSDARDELASARQSVPSAFAEIRAQAASNLRHARQDIGTKAPCVLERAAGLARTAKDSARATLVDTFDRASSSVKVTGDRAQALFREVAGQGPQKTLRRGFAVVRSSEGKTLTTIADVEDGTHIEVSLRDGVVRAVARTVKPGPTDES